MIPTSQEFNRDSSRAKKATAHGPVFISNRGKLAHVLLSISDYKRLIGLNETISDLLALPGTTDIELPIPDRRELATGARLFNP